MANVLKVVSHKEETIEAMLEQLQGALEGIGSDASSTAAQKGVCPIDTGNLRNSIGFAVVEKTVYIGTNVDYALVQEVGGSHIKGHHYLQFGISAHKEEYKNMIQEALDG